MENMKYMENEYKVFEMFSRQWALVSAGSIEKHNACTVSWGSLGTLWTRPGKSGATVTVYIHPSRYTYELLKENEYFTVSFFPQKYKKALGYMGSHSGRNENKDEAAGLTVTEAGESVTYKEAEMTFVCRKIYAHQLTVEDIASDVQDYYRANPTVYPGDKEGQWQPHYVFVGEIVDVLKEGE